MKRCAGMILACGLVIAACSTGESKEEAVVSALSASLLQDPTFDGYEITDEEAGCVATDAVAALGADRMIEIGATEDASGDVDFEQLADEEIVVLGDAMETCVADIENLLVDAIAAGILEEPDPDFPVTDAEARCVGQAMAEEFSLSRMIILGVREDSTGNPFTELADDEIQVFTDAMLGCIDVRQILLDGIAATGAPDDALACLDANISDEDIEALFLAGFRGEDSDAAAEAALGPAVEACA